MSILQCYVQEQFENYLVKRYVVYQVKHVKTRYQLCMVIVCKKSRSCYLNELVANGVRRLINSNLVDIAAIESAIE